ncbi:Retrovirus-related Pol polyprotein from transposon TNT 1-94 [Vitis vinifera]|uniref:Retrovirus-related Pol polyprotein from transposon TNT 1-94 n=1 Tax=Vitis vinifera TaxID=29760 RepID=A0A438FGC6_VITVI|nr:Retrovirus-related Pol polyprotein from transposon TNT 1-94 [Vitis vinifera]
MSEGADQVATTSKVRSLIPTCFTGFNPVDEVKFNIEMGTKIKEITRRLGDSSTRKVELGFDMVPGVETDGVSGVRDHIIKLKHYFNKANEMKVELSEKFLKWLILESLPASFDAVKLTYNALKEEWTLEELMSIVQFKRRGNSSQGAPSGSASSNGTKNEKFKWKCNFCHKVVRKRVDCFKFKNWLEKKKDTGATIHVTNSLQEMTKKKRPSKHEEFVYMGDGSKVKVEFFGMIKLRLATKSFLLLHDVAYIPSLRRNLIFVSVLDRRGYSFNFGCRKVDIFSDSVLNGNGVLFGNLYSLSLHHGPLGDSSSVNSVVGCKRARMNLGSSMLWHKRLGHISRQRLERLVRDDVLSNLDFSDFKTCVVCLNGKMTAKTRNEKIDRCGSTLNLIHTDICGPLTPTALVGCKYFITFIDDFSRYGYVELIHEKSDSLNVFKTFKAKVELQLGKPIKAVKSDRGGEYYGRYDETGRNPGPFAKFLLKCGIDAYNARFYCPSHTTRIIESDRAVYFEDEVNVDPNFVPREIPFGEEHVVIPFPISHVPNVDVPIVQQPTTNQGEHGDQVELGIPIDDTVVNGIILRRSQRVCRPAISDDYMIYLQEHEYDVYDASDPTTYQKAIHCPQFTYWKKSRMMK